MTRPEIPLPLLLESILMGVPMVLYTQLDSRTDRGAVVRQEFSAIQPFIVYFYEGSRLDHTRRYSSAGLAESAADEWCGIC